MQRLILFDIDGTLLSCGKAAARAFCQALEAIYGTAGPVETTEFAGKTDPQIARELLAGAGLPGPKTEEGWDELWRLYPKLLRQELETAQINVFPGVVGVLDALRDAPGRAVVGLLTGNIEAAAEIKLRAAEIGWDQFTVGAFGSDHADRRQLPQIAVSRAERRLGTRFGGQDVVIIGDTPADISCGESLGVRTVAVATGSYSAAKLSACGPDAVFEDFSDQGAVWEAIFGEPRG